MGDFYEFSPETGWKKIEELIVTARQYACAFRANDEIFLVFGTAGYSLGRDVKKFSPDPLSWIPMKPLKYEEFPDITARQTHAVVQNQGGRDYAYIFGGNICYLYDSIEDKWSEVSGFKVGDFNFSSHNDLYMVSDISTYKFVKNK